MMDTIKKIAEFLASGLITAGIHWATRSGFFPRLVRESPAEEIIMYIIVFLVLFIISEFIINGGLRAHIDLWRIGKIRGLWATERGLKRQIKKGFYSANDIKLKVTRGADLLDPNNKYGLYKILKDLKDGKGKSNSPEVNIKVLLIVPCFKEQHVKERFERHTDMTPEQFLESWYKFISEIRLCNTEHLSINIRFYLGSHARWRFYILSKPNGANTTVLLSEYDRNTPGSSGQMYKIIRGENNIGTFMTSYFDELWNSALTPKKLRECIQSGLCQSSFCNVCMRNEQCQKCGKLSCDYQNACKKFAKKYKDALESFNVEVSTL